MTYAGFMEAIFCSLLDLTNSPPMKRPRGWDHFLPLGAVIGISMFLSLNVRENEVLGEDEKGREYIIRLDDALRVNEGILLCLK